MKFLPARGRKNEKSGCEGISCPETSVSNHQPTPSNIPAERRPPVHRDGNLKSRVCQFYPLQTSHGLPWRRISSTAISNQLLKACDTARRAYIINVPFNSAYYCQSSSRQTWSCIGLETKYCMQTTQVVKWHC